MIKRWTYEERVKLKKLYGTMPMDELLTYFPERNARSIYDQVYYLRKRRWTFNRGKENG